MYDRELMRQLKPINKENREARFAERDKLKELCKRITRLNAQEMIKEYGMARVIRVLAAAIKCNPQDYTKEAVRRAYAVPPMCNGWDAEKFFNCPSIHRVYLQDMFIEYTSYRLV